MRDGPYHARQGQSSDCVRRVQGPVQPAEYDDQRRAAILGGRGILVRQRWRVADLSLPARLADGGVAVRAAHGLLRVAIFASLKRWWGDMADDQSRSDGAP